MQILWKVLIVGLTERKKTKRKGSLSDMVRKECNTNIYCQLVGLRKLHGYKRRLAYFAESKNIFTL
jgi:hypothetical protein